MKVVLRQTRREIDVDGPTRVSQLLKDLDAVLESVLVIRGSELPATDEVEECPKAAGNTVNRYKRWLDRFEEESPGVKAQFLFGFFDRAAGSFAVGSPPVLNQCSSCGRATTGDICAFCRLSRVVVADIGRQSG